MPSFVVLPRPMEMEMVMVLFPTMTPVIARHRVRVFRSVFAARCTVLGVRVRVLGDARRLILGNARGLMVMILSMMRRGGRRIIGR